MSEKLKTLENMSFREDGSLDKKDPAKLYLKAEAIKWLKAEDAPKMSGMTAEWIKHFFNIIDEEINSKNILESALRKIYDALVGTNNAEAICLLEQVKLDILLNDKLVVIDGNVGIIKKDEELKQ